MLKSRRPVLSILSAILICALLMVSFPVLDTLINPEGPSSGTSEVLADDGCEGCSNSYQESMKARADWENCADGDEDWCYQRYLAAGNTFMRCYDQGCDTGVPTGDQPPTSDSSGEPDPCFGGYEECEFVWTGNDECLRRCQERYNACTPEYEKYRILSEKYGKCLESITRCDVPESLVFHGLTAEEYLEKCRENYNACKPTCNGDSECLKNCEKNFDDCKKAYDEYIAFKAKCDADYQSFCEKDPESLWQKIIAANNKYVPLSTGNIQCEETETKEPDLTKELEIKVRTDKDNYDQGDAVTITAAVTRGDKPVKGAIVWMEVSCPGGYRGEIKPGTKGGQVATRLLTTNDSGKVSIVPFAGHSLGEYTIKAWAELPGDEKKSEPGNWEFTVKRSQLSADRIEGNLKEIERRYKKEIPVGPIWRFYEDAKKALSRFPERWTLAPVTLWGGELSELEYYQVNLVSIRHDDENGQLQVGKVKRYTKRYLEKLVAKLGGKDVEAAGSYNNSLGHENGYQCAGYEHWVIGFLDSLRFGSNAAHRALLKGIDYGPIRRGPAPLAGEHHSVVIYRSGTKWSSAQQKVFDPWLTQRPEVTTISDFTKRWLWRWSLVADPNYLSTPYPIHKAPVYVNYKVFPLASPFKRAEASAPPPIQPGRPEKIDNHVVFRCPANPLITNAEGQRVGLLPDGSLVNEMDAALHVRQLDDGTLAWYFGLSSGNYQAVFTGTATGTFHLMTSSQPGIVQDYGDQAINKGEQVRITLDPSNPGAPLNLPDGKEVLPTTEGAAGVSIAPPFPIHLLLFGVAGVAGLAALALLLFLLVRRRKPGPVAPPVPPPARPVRPRGRPEELVSRRPPARPEGPPERLGGGKPSGPPETLD